MSVRQTFRGIVRLVLPTHLLVFPNVAVVLGLATLGLLLFPSWVLPTSAQPVPDAAVSPARLAAQAVPSPSPGRLPLANDLTRGMLPLGVASDPMGGLYAGGGFYVVHFGGTGITADRAYGNSSHKAGEVAGAAILGDVYAVAADPVGGLYVADSFNRVLHFSGSSTIADRVYGQNGDFAGFRINHDNGNQKPGAVATGLWEPHGVAVEPTGGLYIADTMNNRVLHFSGSSTTPDRVYGQNGSFTASNPAVGDATGPSGPGGATGLYRPTGVAADPAGGLYVADTGNFRVLHFSGTNATPDRVYRRDQASLNLVDARCCGAPAAHQVGLGIATDPAGGLYEADSGDNRVLHFSGSSTTADHVYGQNGDFMTSGWARTAEGMYIPNSVAVDQDGGLYIADQDCANANGGSDLLHGVARVLHFSAASTSPDRAYLCTWPNVVPNPSDTAPPNAPANPPDQPATQTAPDQPPPPGDAITPATPDGVALPDATPPPAEDGTPQTDIVQPIPDAAAVAPLTGVDSRAVPETLTDSQRADILSAVDRANAVWVQALQTQDSSVLNAVVAGQLLNIDLAEVDQLRRKGQTMKNINTAFTVGSVTIDAPGHAVVRTSETWYGETYNSATGGLLERTPSATYAETYAVEYLNGGWIVIKNDVRAE